MSRKMIIKPMTGAAGRIMNERMALSTATI
jgi:hypothetical protein